MIGRSPAFVRAVRMLDRFAACDAPVLIEGETGTGKELAARHVHYGGARRAGPFVPINCGAIPDALAENELFGHERGAFTDARGESPGCVALAHGGTLFLDEIDSLSPKGQVSLLRFLQDRTYRPLGGRTECRADVRIVAASNVSLEPLADRGGFRRDLLFRIKLLYVEMPRLRAREGDVPLLAEHFLSECSRWYAIPPKRLDLAATAWLERQEWPGNVRELENVVHRAVLLCEGPAIGVGDLVSDHAATASPAASSTQYRSAKSEAMEAFHRRFLSELIRASGGNLSSAARLCGADRRMLGRLLKRYRIDPAAYRDA
ncbi:MAG TPA: sigma-54 dependent transcriptional regulator [Anaeromyxobacteraceae bacterium]|nr:sigma-54 dependent transcriptional regulator [Anaeromyxobacteraceae bacterium]